MNVNTIKIFGLLALAGLSSETFGQNAGEVNSVERGLRMEAGFRYWRDPATRDNPANQAAITEWLSLKKRLDAADASELAEVMKAKLEDTGLRGKLHAQILEKQNIDLVFDNGTAFDATMYMLNYIHNKSAATPGQKDAQYAKLADPVTVHILLNPTQAKEQSNNFGGRLDAYYKKASDDFTAQFIKDYTSNQEFHLTIDPEEAFQGRRSFSGFVFVPSIEAKDGKEVLKVNLARKVRKNGKAKVEVISDQDLMDEFDLDEKDLANIKPSYVLKPSPEVEDFKKVLATRSLTLQGFDGKNAFSREDDHIVLRVKNIAPTLSDKAAFIVLDGRVIEKNSVGEFTAEQLENAEFIGVSYDPEALKAISLKLKPKKRSAIDPAADIFMKEFSPRLVPAIECKT